ncbi:hypothetical protein ABPG72_006031 [Tetrahymena utriculariae]
MITNNKSSEEVIALLEGGDTKVFAFYKYEFTQEIILKMKLAALNNRKIMWSLSECQNFSKENIYEIFSQLSKNQILEKFHFNFLLSNDLESKNYSELYSYLQGNAKLKSLNCPHYGIMLQSTLDLFHKNQNINRLQVSILDIVYYKVILNFMSQIRKSFDVLKFKQTLLNINLINQFQNLFKNVTSVQLLNQRFAFNFCSIEQPTSEETQNQQKQQQQHKKGQNKNQGKQHGSPKTNIQQKDLDLFLNTLLQDADARKISSSRYDIDLYRRESIKSRFNIMSFALAKCYIQHMKFFNEFFSEKDFENLIIKYEVKNLDQFIFNFSLATALTLNVNNKQIQKKYQYLYNQYLKLYQSIDQNEQTNSSNVIQKLMFVLNIINFNSNNQKQYSDFVKEFIPTYFEQVLESVQFYSKSSFNLNDILFASKYYNFSQYFDKQDAFDKYCKVLSLVKLDQNQTISKYDALNLIQAASHATFQQKQFLNQNQQVLDDILKMCLDALDGDLQKEINLEFVYFYIMSSETFIKNKEENMKYCKLLEKNLQREHSNQIKTNILYSLGKSSIVTPKIKEYIQSSINNIQTEKIHQFDKYVSCLLLCAANLGIITKDNISKFLIESIFSSDKKFRYKYIDYLAIAFYRIQYFEKDVWEQIFQRIDYNQESFYLNLIRCTYKAYQNQMSQETLALFDQNVGKQTKSFTLKENPIQIYQEVQLKNYLEQKNISYKQSQFIDGFYINFALSEKDIVLLLKYNCFLVEENSTEVKYNLSTQSKIDYLQKQGYNLIILNSSEGDVCQQFEQAYKPQN